MFATFAVTLQAGAVTAVRIAYGGMAGIPKRATATEKALIGLAWNEATVRTAMGAMTTDFTPLSDIRATAAYRTQIAQNLLLRFWLETSGETVEARVL